MLLSKGGKEFFYGHMNGLWRYNKEVLKTFETYLNDIEQKIRVVCRPRVAQNLIKQIHNLNLLSISISVNLFYFPIWRLASSEHFIFSPTSFCILNG